MIGALLIAGPTASGKSALALALAQRFGAIVVNADSMQVYADLRTLSARPTRAEEGLAPHRLFGEIDGAVNFSAGLWARRAAAVIGEAQAEVRPVIVVGGAGLYFRALTEGLSDMPAVPEELRARSTRGWGPRSPSTTGVITARTRRSSPTPTTTPCAAATRRWRTRFPNLPTRSR